MFAIGGSKQTWVGTCRILNKFKLGVDAWVRVKKRGKNILVYLKAMEIILVKKLKKKLYKNHFFKKHMG